MRLLILGPLEGYISTAGKIAIARGATVAHADDIEQGLGALRSGHGADLLMMDVKLDIARMIESLKQERINVPVVACGVGTDADAAVRAIKAGAKEYIPLPPDAELIAAVIEAVAQESHALLFRDPVMAEAVRLAEQVSFTDNADDVTVVVDHWRRADFVIEQQSGDFADARIEWAEGGAERNTKRLLSDIDAALTRALETIHVTGTTPHEGEPS